MVTLADESLDRSFAALGDATRRRIVATLADREPLTTNELARLFPMTRWAVMKHLSVLRTAGLVQTLPQGRRRLHFVDRHSLGDARRWMEAIDPSRAE